MEPVRELRRMKTLTGAVIGSSLLDFGINTVYVPALSTDLFIAVVFSMVQIVTVLFQFFSWFFMLTSMRQVKLGGYSILFKNFWHLFLTTSAYVFLFVIDKVVLFSMMNKNDQDFYDFWDNWALIILWSIERIVAVVHYSYSIYYIIMIFSNTHYFRGY